MNNLPAPNPPTNASEDWVLLETYLTDMEAQFARGFLESSGIATKLGDEHIARLGIHLSAIAGGIKLWVLREDEETARELLDEVQDGEEDEEH